MLQVHLSIIHTAYPQRAGGYLQHSMGERLGTPWTGRQSIAEITPMCALNHFHLTFTGFILYKKKMSI